MMVSPSADLRENEMEQRNRELLLDQFTKKPRCFRAAAHKRKKNNKKSNSLTSRHVSLHSSVPSAHQSDETIHPVHSDHSTFCTNITCDHVMLLLNMSRSVKIVQLSLSLAVCSSKMRRILCLIFLVTTLYPFSWYFVDLVLANHQQHLCQSPGWQSWQSWMERPNKNEKNGRARRKCIRNPWPKEKKEKKLVPGTVDLDQADIQISLRTLARHHRPCPLPARRRLSRKSRRRQQLEALLP
jgi:hypothetical protein